MRKLRIVAVLVVVLGVLGLAGPAADAGPPGSTDVSVAVPMTCAGATPAAQTITVSATLPDRVRAGRAYTVTNLTTGVPNGGAVTIAVGDGSPTAIAAGSGGSSTMQLVAGTQPGRAITLQVTRADYLIPGQILSFPRPVLIPGVPISCTPAAPATLGSIKVIGRGSGPGSETTGIDVTLGLLTRILDQPFASNPSRVTATVPAELHPGDTFTVPDIVVAVPDVPFTVEPLVSLDGADPQAVTPGSVHTVTAQPGETVELSLVSIAYNVSVVSSSPISSGHVASIPVVAG
jgi:hypothetical protein